MSAFKDFVRRYKISGGALLDVGCRDQTLRADIEALGFTWTGVDREPAAENVSRGLLENLPFPNASFDVVFACHSFEHCEHPIDALREFKRVTKRYVFIATPSPCEKQILNADSDHVFVLNTLQMRRLLQYVQFPLLEVYLQCEGIPIEQDFNVITIGVKK